MNIAVIKAGGKQYLVKPGQELKVEKIDAEIGASIDLEALLSGTTDGATVAIGKPLVKGQIKATIVKQGRNEKILVVKFQRKTRFRKRVGHRQPNTTIKISDF